MIKVYVTLVESGRKNFFDVPAKFADAVRAKIEADGYTINSDGTVSKN